MKSNTLIQNNKLYWVYLIGFFLILALPLLNLPPWFSPSDWGKTIFFRIVLSVLIFLFIYQLLFQKGQVKNSTIVGILRQRKNKAFWPFWLLIALLGIYFLATIFSLDTRFSLWGNPYRSGGFVNFAFYIILVVLMLFILDKKGWQKIWGFTIIIGILVSIIAIFQRFGILSQIFISREAEVIATLGLPSALGIYLLFLGFLTLSFTLKEKRITKKIFYFIPLPFFFIGILISTSQAAYLGLVFGFLWFLFFYPKKMVLLKIVFGALIILGIFGFYSLNQDHVILKYIPSTLLSWKMDVGRISSWKVSWMGIKDRPILGYGPENFNIGFDRHYDPSLPEIEKHAGFHSSWWDRAHNFIFDIALTAGIPALIIYLSLFGILFFQLQKLKNAQRQSATVSGNQNSIVCHGIQAAFIGFLAANFFSFDVFSTYLISFLIVGYSLHLLSKNKDINQTIEHRFMRMKRIYADIIKWKKPILVFLLFLLIWFIWSYNIKPFQINTQINIAKYLANNKQCEQAFTRMENILPKKSFLDNYARLKYTDYLRRCEGLHPEKSLEYAQKGVQLLKENIKIRPYYTRNWILLGGFTSVLIEKEINPEVRQELIKETNDYFEKAYELSPKHQEVFIEWAKYGIVSEKYQLIKEKSQKCIDLNPKLADCYWYIGLSEIFLGNLEEGKKNIETAKEKRYSVNSLISLNQLSKAHSIAENYQELVEVYQKLIKINPKEPQYHATLAFVYKELGDYQKAKEEALKVLELQPEARELVEEFLKTLPY